jgi:peptide/nickel transport system permease protein
VSADATPVALGPLPAARAGRLRHELRALPPRAWVGGGIVLALVLVGLLAPLLAPHDPYAIGSGNVVAGPSFAHPLGCDSEGRDVLSRLLYAYRVSLGIAVGSTLAALLAGGTIGIVAGYYKGWMDTLAMRPVDMMLAFPAMLLAITLIAIVGTGAPVVILAIGTIYIPIFARVVRSSTLTVSTALYVDAARCRGASSARIVWQHVIPNAIGPALVQASILAGIAIQVEAALSFLGLGAQPPTPSLGVMLADGRDFLQQSPTLELFPGIAIAIAVCGFLLLGDGLRARLDPRGVA